MRKLLTVLFVTAFSGSLFAGGLVTNTNQSAAWVRLPARNASTSVDAAYFNPAGLTKLADGFHFSLSNQTIVQTKEVENFYTGPGGLYGLNESLYIGDVSAPVYPTAYAVYKKDRIAFSLGFNPIGGGGGAIYNRGLPSFEMAISDLVPALAASQGATAYRLDAFLEGSSVFFGIQGGVSFKINEWLSVAAGLRYVTAKNTYMGHLKDVEINTSAGWTRADAIMTGISQAAKTGGDQLQPLITGGLGGLTPAAAAAAGYITTTQAQQITGGLTALGVPNASSLTISQSQTAYYGAQAKYAANATVLADQTVDVEQNASGFSPIFSVNISPTENLNIAVKYEMKTKMELENNTTEDFLMGYQTNGTPITMFPDGDLTPADMPAMLSLGLDYKAGDAVTLSLGSNIFFDKAANYGHKMNLDLNSSTPTTFVDNDYIIDHNGWSLQTGIEVDLTEKLLVSGGYVFANKGVNDNYQSDLTYGLATHTFGAGGAYRILENLLLNAGVSYTAYVDDDRLVNHVFTNGTLYQPKETYAKKTFLFGIGLDYNF